MLVRVLQGQFFLCNVLCNAGKIGLAGFVWFAVLATYRYLSLLEIDIRFIEKQFFARINSNAKQKTYFLLNYAFQSVAQYQQTSRLRQIMPHVQSRWSHLQKLARHFSH